MSDALRLVLAFAGAFAITSIAVPLVTRLAIRTDFLDRPTGYKQHGSPTPYLGGIAVVAGVLLVGVPLASGLSALPTLIVCLVGLAAVGTFDDRIGLKIWLRLLAEAGAGAAFHFAGLGWSPFESDAANLAITVLLFVGVINAYNLMDNLDGAAATVAFVSAFSIGIYAAAEGSPALGALGLGLAGACAAFLPHNLARPAARIFLGDGGSVPVGMVIALLIANLPNRGATDWELLAVTLVLVGLPALDTALVMFSRRRRGVQLLSGGRDHLTHRLLPVLGSPRRVAVALAVGQVFFTLTAVLLLGLDQVSSAAGAAACVGVGVAAILLLEFAPSASRARERSPA
jgi:UDP-GlcNAc:undecaprenyl-phosphate GlcNAc-1-phosphate transferase